METYQETIAWMFSKLPMFQRKGAAAYRPGLEAMQQLDQYLGNPHQAYPCIHIGGTNGKGSTAHMMVSVLQTAGFKTGLYTSPHLLDFRERITNGNEAHSDAKLFANCSLVILPFKNDVNPLLSSNTTAILSWFIGL